MSLRSLVSLKTIERSHSLFFIHTILLLYIISLAFIDVSRLSVSYCQCPVCGVGSVMIERSCKLAPSIHRQCNYSSIRCRMKISMNKNVSHSLIDLNTHKCVHALSKTLLKKPLHHVNALLLYQKWIYTKFSQVYYHVIGYQNRLLIKLSGSKAGFGNI